MAHLFISRLLETFFRRWWLYVLPIIPFLALGVFTVVSSGDSYRSSGTILVDRSGLLDQMQGIRNTGQNTFGFDTPAAFTARELNEFLATDEFLNKVIDTADLRSLVETGLLTEDEVRSSVAAAAQGDVSVDVSATNDDPVLAQQLAQGTMNAFVTWKIERAQTTSTVAAGFYQQQVKDAEARLAEARAELSAYTDNNPAPPAPLERAPEVQAEVDRRTAVVDNAQEALNTINANITAAEESGNAANTEVTQRYQQVDQPQLPAAPEGSRLQDLQTLVLFGFVGFLVAAAALVVATIMDRSVRYGEEVEAHLHVPVMATLPDSKAALKPVGL